MYRANPAPLLEATFERIHVERMAGLPMLNPRLSVTAVGFARHGDDWRGVLVTPWGINLLLLPAVEDWPVSAPHERAFRHYPAGTFAFLGNREEGLGDYLACPLIHHMQQFADQETAVNTARVCLISLDIAPASPGAADAPESPARRKMFGLRG